MLGKLLKHEFRATGRTLLPVIGAVLLLAVLGNFSIRFINVVNSTLLTILFGLIIAFFVLGLFVAAIMTVWVMVARFYRGLLKDEGYLMHTLPVNVHELIWSRLIVSLVWVAVTAIVVWLVILLTVLIQSGTSLGELFAGFPSWAEIRTALESVGLRSGDLWALLLEFIAAAILGALASFLHFYAAMALGHMFAKDKILLSIVFFVGFSFVFSLLSTGYGSFRMANAARLVNDLDTFVQVVRLLKSVILEATLLEAVHAAILYVATVFGLKRGLNLA